MLTNLLLWGAWVFLSVPTLIALTRMFAEPSSRTNAILAGVALALLATRVGWSKERLRAALQRAPQWNFGIAVLLTAGAAGQVLRPWLHDSKLLAGLAFTLGTYALAGLYLTPRRWLSALPGVMLAVLLLPFGTHLDAYLGFPARIATAQIVEQVLRAAGVAVQSAEAILVLENGVASVDLPCSGVKGLWVGGVFFLALSWVEGRRLGARWLCAGAAYVLALASANALRVLLLVVIGFACRAPAVAELVHVPLGVFGFVISSALAVVLLRRLPERAAAGEEATASSRGKGPTATVLETVALEAAEPSRWKSPTQTVLATAGLVLLALARPSSPALAATQASTQTAVILPSHWSLSRIPLDAKEEQLFGRHQVSAASKWRFRVGSTRGSLLIVSASSFRAHHAPEICLAGAGHVIGGIRREVLIPELPLKFVELDHGRATGIYWFQSRRQTTDALLERTLAELFHDDLHWALVSVLFDEHVVLDPPTQALLQQLHAAVAQSLAAPHEEGV